jgi:hypothetical protein
MGQARQASELGRHLARQLVFVHADESYVMHVSKFRGDGSIDFILFDTECILKIRNIKRDNREAG